MDDAWFQDAMAKLGAAQGWVTTVVRFATAFTWYTGPRSKELRLTSIEDVDLLRQEWIVEHPKGEGSYATKGRAVDLLDELEPYIVDFRDARTTRLRDYGLDLEKVKALAPNERGDFYSPRTWSSMRYRTFRRLGIQGDYRLMRKSHLQHFMDEVQELDYRGTSAAELVALRGRHSVATALKDYVEYQRGTLRRVVREISARKKGPDEAVHIEAVPGWADRLKALQELRSNGWIDEGEFQRLRTAVLDRLVEAGPP